MVHESRYIAVGVRVHAESLGPLRTPESAKGENVETGTMTVFGQPLVSLDQDHYGIPHRNKVDLE